MDAKKLECVIINGFPANKINELHRWNRSSNTIDIVMKPQWFHSAAAIIILHLNPSLVNEKSFYNDVKLNEAYYIQIAKDVLASDEDGALFLKNLSQISEAIIIDDHNKKTLKI